MMTKPPRRAPSKTTTPKRRQAPTPTGIEEQIGRLRYLDAAAMDAAHRAAVAWLRGHRAELDSLVSAALDRSLLPAAGKAPAEPPLAVDDRLALRLATEAIELSAPFLARLMLSYVAASGPHLDQLRAAVADLLELLDRQPPIVEEN
jgi:hypothetical protein